MLAPSSPADVLDRLTILDLKVDRIHDPERVRRAGAHRAALEQAWVDGGLPPRHTLPEHHELAGINARLWDVEDALRDHEARGCFDQAFVELARSVYRLNDARAEAKARLDERLGARWADVKSYGTTG